jgi:hypothetical protein
MSLLTYNYVLDRVRGKLRTFKQDAKQTDREIWNLYKPWLSQTIKELDSKNKLMAFNALFQTLDVVPLVEVDKLEAGCTKLKSGFTIMRTEDPVGELFMEAYWGGMIRSVTSIDGSEGFQPITPEGYQRLSETVDFKYNKTLYYWYLNDYLYFPNISWNAVRIVAITEDDISKYKCDSDERCLPKQEQSLNIPDYILARVESLLFQSLGLTLQIPVDNTNDNKSPMNT